MTEAEAGVELSACEFESGSVRCRGWFYQPPDVPPYPCVVMAHGFGAAPGGLLSDVAKCFAAAGIAAFAFDFRHFGASEGEPRQLLDIGRQLDDWHAAIASVRARDDVDPARVGVWGSSLTGGEVLAVIARDQSIAAAVAQVPYFDGISLIRAAGFAHNLRILPAVVRDLLRSGTGRRPYLIPALGPPGALALVGTKFPDLYLSLRDAEPTWQNQVAARSILEMYRFRPLRIAEKVGCPLLVVASYEDRVAPPGPAMRAAQRLPYVELALLRARHFDLYVGEARERAWRTETKFFVQHLTG